VNAQPDEPYRARPEPAPLARPFGAATRWVFGVVAFLMMSGLCAGIALIVGAFFHKNEFGVEDQDMSLAGLLGVCGAAVLVYVQVLVAAVWMYKAWSWLPPAERHSKMWRGAITPMQAGGFLLVPYFNFYWMFVSNYGLCDALERMRAAHPARPAPRGVAMNAMIAQIVQLFVPIPISPILWLVYMTRAERMMREMAGA
jgi:hypothetical protein